MMRESPSAVIQLQLASARAALFLADEHLSYLLQDLGGEACMVEPGEISGFRSTVRTFMRLLTRRLTSTRMAPFVEALQQYVETTPTRGNNPPGLDRAWAAIGMAASELNEAYWAMADDAGDATDAETVEAMADMLGMIEERLRRFGRRAAEPGLN